MGFQTKCQNCHSPRRSVKAGGLCSVCFVWQQRIDKYSAKLKQAWSDPGKYYCKHDAKFLPLRREIAKQVLKELCWREEGLQTNSTDAWRVDALVRILAQNCRSKVAFNSRLLIERMSPQSRRLIYEALLVLVENIPTLEPILHDGWERWYHDFISAPEHNEYVKEVRGLEKAYLDSRKQN